ncbi:MAG: GTP cyclohydrolase II [Reyranellaceae bacterium]
MHSGNGGEHLSPIQVLFGSDAQTTIGRALAEVRAGRPILIVGPEGGSAIPLLALPAERLQDATLMAFREFVAPGTPRLVLSARRACAIGQHVKEPVRLELPAAIDAGTVLGLVKAPAVTTELETTPASALERAGIRLTKHAQLLPALLAADVPTGRLNAMARLTVQVEEAAIDRFLGESHSSLSIVSEAYVPLESNGRARFVIFRDGLGETSTAVIVGKPDPAGPVPVRLHSACLTGDVFGSRRCDCGDQLRLALARLSEIGGGIVLYLSQEGRGLGLANKMRAYALQDTGLDTVDANTMLGFDDDERDYGTAARMLRLLGCNQVRLLTNNPAKLEGLARAGIDLAGRIPLEAAINADNRRYMMAKAERAGHQFEALATQREDKGAPEPVA